MYTYLALHIIYRVIFGGGPSGIVQLTSTWKTEKSPPEEDG
jgi:hypothetical protein